MQNINVNDFTKEISSAWQGATINKIVTSIILLIVLFVLIKFVTKILGKIVETSKIEKSLKTFINNILKIILYFFGISIVASYIGIDTSSFIAAFSIFGLAISLSIQNTMQNLASGVSILINKPFKVGDSIIIDNIEVVVIEINFMYTKVKNANKDVIYYPNNKIAQSVISNVSEDEYRRIDMTIGASYECDIFKVKEAINEAINRNHNIEKNMNRIVNVLSYDANEITYCIKCFAKNENYFLAKYELTEEIKKVFDERNIQIPYTQIDIHLQK
ncbi:MAG: mechanosensitive ion channel family protein [Eubacteriales bacterium]|nr:mechanosensitive ion channel family protein [Eubacteriales bacterium]